VYDEQYQGPLDSLLEAARKQDVELSRVSISRLLDEFVSHINMRDDWTVNTLSSYLLIFSELVRIKTRAMLPSPGREKPEKDRRELDGEREFFQKLGGELRDKARLRSRLFDTRPDVPDRVEKGETKYEEVTLFELIKAFRQVMVTRREGSEIPDFDLTDNFQVEERKEHIMSLTDSGEKIPFYDLLSSRPGREEVIVTFLALLQLVKNERLSIIRHRDSEEIFVTGNGEKNEN
ncbi:MAG: segregation and condensation protein A, partial [bacterium]